MGVIIASMTAIASLCDPSRAEEATSYTRIDSTFLQVLLLENVRFYKEEEKNDIEFAKNVRRPASYLSLARTQPTACAAGCMQRIYRNVTQHTWFQGTQLCRSDHLRACG